MARSGDVIENPMRGETIRFLRTATDTRGEFLRLEVAVRGNSRGAGGAHIHPKQEERFRVLEGSIRVRVGREVRDLAEGEVAVVPAGTVHTFWNPFDSEARVEVEVRPALRLETLAETDFGLACDGRSGRNGEMKLLQAAVTLTEFAPEIRIPHWPVRLLLRVLAPVGRLLGCQAFYARYGMPPGAATKE